jgi:RNA polymerase sigma factor for flagellar operon FliA
VKYVAGKMAIATPAQVEYEDLVSYGIIGLIDAIEKFDFERSIQNGKIDFKNYAIRRIKGAIIDELRLLDWVPRAMRRKLKQVEEAYARLEKKLNRPATDDEICAELGIDRKELSQMLLEFAGTTLVSLDEVWYIGENENEIVAIDTVEGPESQSPEVMVEKEEIKEKLTEAIKRLPKQEKEVVALYYYEDLTLKEIGEVLGLTESRICQLHAKAIIRLRSFIKREMQDFFERRRRE